MPNEDELEKQLEKLLEQQLADAHARIREMIREIDRRDDLIAPDNPLYGKTRGERRRTMMPPDNVGFAVRAGSGSRSA